MKTKFLLLALLGLFSVPFAYSDLPDPQKPERLVAAATADVHAPSSNTAAVVTYAAATNGSRHVVSGLTWSYSGGTPTNGNLKIENGSGSVVFTMDITTSGAGFVDFPLPKMGSQNTALIITLSAGGSGVSGKLSVKNHWTIK